MGQKGKARGFAYYYRTIGWGLLSHLFSFPVETSFHRDRWHKDGKSSLCPPLLHLHLAEGRARGLQGVAGAQQGTSDKAEVRQQACAEPGIHLRLTVTPYHRRPHACQNGCSGVTGEGLLEEKQRDTVLCR